MVGQVDQQRAVVAGAGAPVQDTPITVQLDGEAEPWKIDSRTRAKALSPACSAATMAWYR